MRAQERSLPSIIQVLMQVCSSPHRSLPLHLSSCVVGLTMDSCLALLFFERVVPGGHSGAAFLTQIVLSSHTQSGFKLT